MEEKVVSLSPSLVLKNSSQDEKLKKKKIKKEKAMPQCMYNVIIKLLLIILNDIVGIHTQ